MIETDGDRKWCQRCKEYKASVRKYWIRCADLCLCDDDYDWCDACAMAEGVTDE